MNTIYYILTLEVKDIGIPKLIAQYLIDNTEWKSIRKLIENKFYFNITDEEISNKDIEISNETTKYSIDDNIERVKAFRCLYKNYFGTYDILDAIKNKKKQMDHIFTMDMDMNMNMDINMNINLDEDNINYYLMTKKNTPEFSSIDDKKVYEYVRETQKVFNQFKK